MKMVLTLAECAILLRVSERTIRRQIKEGVITTIEFGHTVRIPVSQFEGLCDEEAIIECIREEAEKAGL